MNSYGLIVNVSLTVVLVYFVLFADSITFVFAADQLEYCPPTINDTIKICSLRGNLVDSRLWRHFSGFFCYNYTNIERLSFKYNYTFYPFQCDSWSSLPSLPIAIVNITTTTYAFFFFFYEKSLQWLQKSFNTLVSFNNYVSCCKEAVNCCNNVMNNENLQMNGDYCPVVWDAWSCFPRTRVNTTTRLPCSSQAYQSPDHVCTLESEKDCYWNETVQLAMWNQQTNYNTCAIAPVYRKRHQFHIYFFMVCIVWCLPAIIIFFAFEKLRRNTRVILHRNLLIAIVIRNVFTILAKTFIILDALKSSTVSNRTMENNSVACRVLSFFDSSSKNSIYACMLVDGFYLHKVIVRSFAKEPNIVHLYAVVAFLTFVPSFIWATILAVNNRHNCWYVDSYGEQWAVDSFRMLVLAINTLLLLDIIRVMVSKMKQRSTTHQTKAAFRATLFLIPLFGIHIMVTAKKIVYDDSCTAEDVYDYARYSMEALQGIFVAVLFCYANSEVHNEIRNAYRKLTIFLNERFGWNVRRPTTMRRRTTTATYVQPESKF